MMVTQSKDTAQAHISLVPRFLGGRARARARAWVQGYRPGVLVYHGIIMLGAVRLLVTMPILWSLEVLESHLLAGKMWVTALKWLPSCVLPLMVAAITIYQLHTLL